MSVLRAAITRRVLGPVSFPQYAAVGLHEPQQHVEVVWVRARGEPIDVTGNNVVTSLSPLTIGVMLGQDGRSGEPAGAPSRLEFRERQGAHRLLGAVHLRFVRDIALAPHVFRLFEACGCENYCLPALTLRLYYAYERWRTERQQRRNPHNFRMTHPDLRALFVFYICPRPVMLVTVSHEGLSNIFPMDLIGPTDSRWYSMALRATSPAVSLIQRSRCLALGRAPLSYKAIAYELGKHHKQTSVDWAALPFETAPSPLFGLPVPTASLGVREVRVEAFHQVGSHVLFVTSVANDTAPAHAPGAANGLQLFHIHGAYRQHLLRNGIRLEEA